jgi:cytochrome oxidase Cu insertion factor (SCO1/SenC/PrrC family)/uncharacterized membrane protein (Fun14 family)
MPGMGSGLPSHSSSIVSAFQSTLLLQGLVVFVIAVMVGVVWYLFRGVELRGAVERGHDTIRPGFLGGFPEPAGRRLLRISFGLIWIFDGILQGQASMPLGMAPQVIQPSAAASPSWVQHVVNAGATIWSYHPVAAPAAAVWIQIGIGVWLLAAPLGYWSRLAGVASVGWGLIVWIFGESFGGIFAPGLSWLFGAPGAVLFYCLAGILIALPDHAWASRRLGRAVLAVMGAFFVGMAVLQAWPGRGFWQGQAKPGSAAGTVTAMVQQMALTPQPRLLSSGVTAFAGFDSAHGWAVNLFVVIALATIGAAFLTGEPRLVRIGVIAGAVICLAAWVVVQDFGFLGGVGTDPNSMIPMVLVFTAGYLALTRVPAFAPAPSPSPPVDPGWRERWATDPTYAFRSIAALGAVGITLVGVTPMAEAAANPHADAIISQAIDGPPTLANTPAPAFDLLDQHGQPASLQGLQGKAVALTFLDPICASTCRVIAHEFSMTDGILGAAARHVELVAVNTDPRHTSLDYLIAFDRQEGLQQVANWEYLTGSLPELQAVWRAYGIKVTDPPAGPTTDHSEIAYIIDPAGHTRYTLNTNPGPGTQATQSSFSVNLADVLKRVLGPS